MTRVAEIIYEAKWQNNFFLTKMRAFCLLEDSLVKKHYQHFFDHRLCQHKQGFINQ